MLFSQEILYFNEKIKSNSRAFFALLFFSFLLDSPQLFGEKFNLNHINTITIFSLIFIETFSLNRGEPACYKKQLVLRIK